MAIRPKHLKFIPEKIFKILLYITNNEAVSRDEILFDILGLIVATISLIIGCYLFVVAKCPEWITMLLIEYLWYIDNMRHNRT
jgi:hypothetical protein